jgi:cell division protein FtsB
MVDKSTPDSMPSMVPDRDDIRTHTPTGQEKKPNTDVKAQRPVQPKKSNWGTVLLLCLLGVAVILLALQQYSQYQLQQSYEERLSLADERIVNLEKSLTQTDESVAFNETAINAQFKAIKSDTDMHMDEIRKLWDVSNKRNKDWIEENQAAIADQLQQINTAKASLSELATKQAADASAIESINNRIAGFANKDDLDSLAESLEQTQQELASLTAQITEMNAQLDALSQENYEERLLTLTLTQENLLAEQSRNTANLAEISQNIEAIDAGRAETIKRLTALTNQLDTLSARVTALSGAGQ